jgi:hypothetical protein
MPLHCFQVSIYTGTRLVPLGHFALSEPGSANAVYSAIDLPKIISHLKSDDAVDGIRIKMWI